MVKLLKRQVSDIRRGGLIVLRIKASRVPKRIFDLANLLWATPLLLLLRLMKPFILFRFGSIRNDRIGHFTADTSYYLATMPDVTGHEIVDLFWFTGKHSNEQWARMVKSELRVRWYVKYLYLLNRKLPGGSQHIVPPMIRSRDTQGIFQKPVKKFELMPEDNKRAETWMEKRGWLPGQPIICLLVRDSEYLSKTKLHSNAETAPALEGTNNWHYHNYRDTDIKTYRQSISFLLDCGYWVVRMSKIASEPVGLEHNRFIDYPFVSDQDDLMDIWLSRNCRMFISVGSGIDVLADIYCIPAVLVNAIPLRSFHTWKNNIWVPKYLSWRSTNKLLSLREHLQHAYSTTMEYDHAGIAITDLSSADILEAILEQEQRMNGTWADTADDVQRQSRAWEIFKASPDFSKFHNYKDPNARIGAHFLRKMGDPFLN